jgi:hypothetical protein
MVSQEEFERVQSIIHRPHHIQPRKHEFPFTGLIKCGICGCLVTAERKVKRYPTTNRMVVYTYYHCTASKGCRRQSVSEEYIGERITEALAKCRIDREIADWAIHSIEADQVMDIGWDKSLLNTHHRNLELAQLKLRRLYDMRLAEEIMPEDFLRLKGEFEQEISGLQGAINRLHGRAERDRRSACNALLFTSRAYQVFATGPIKVKRQIAAELAKNYLLTLGNLEFTVRPQLARWATFELPKDPPDMVQPATRGSTNPSLRTFWNNYRSLLKDDDEAFPRLECLEQVGEEVTDAA